MRKLFRRSPHTITIAIEANWRILQIESKIPLHCWLPFPKLHAFLPLTHATPRLSFAFFFVFSMLHANNKSEKASLVCRLPLKPPQRFSHDFLISRIFPIHAHTKKASCRETLTFVFFYIISASVHEVKRKRRLRGAACFFRDSSVHDHASLLLAEKAQSEPIINRPSLRGVAQPSLRERLSRPSNFHLLWKRSFFPFLDAHALLHAFVSDYVAN